MHGTTQLRAQHDKCSAEVPYKRNSVSAFDHGPHQSTPDYQNLFHTACMEEERLLHNYVGEPQGNKRLRNRRYIEMY
jgi:hypothetical protein